jgi:hypothetical protein
MRAQKKKNQKKKSPRLGGFKRGSGSEVLGGTKRDFNERIITNWAQACVALF